MLFPFALRKRRYQVKRARHVSGITFIMYAQSQMIKNSSETRKPKGQKRNRLRSAIHLNECSYTTQYIVTLLYHLHFWWRLFLTRIVLNKVDVYVFITKCISLMNCSVATIEKWFQNQEWVILKYINIDLVCATTAFIYMTLITLFI